MHQLDVGRVKLDQDRPPPELERNLARRTAPGEGIQNGIARL
jgi:hypothetical protein